MGLGKAESSRFQPVKNASWIIALKATDGVKERDFEPQNAELRMSEWLLCRPQNREYNPAAFRFLYACIPAGPIRCPITAALQDCPSVSAATDIRKNFPLCCGTSFSFRIICARKCSARNHSIGSAEISWGEAHGLNWNPWGQRLYFCF